MLDSDDALGFVINAVARKFSQLFNVWFKDFDITSEQWSVLNKLTAYNGISQRELASIVEKDPNNITRLIDQLEKKGLVKRLDNPLDRRSYVLHVTENGEQLVAKLRPLDQKLAADLLNSLSIKEVEVFQKKLHKINQILSDKLNKP